MQSDGLGRQPLSEWRVIRQERQFPARTVGNRGGHSTRWRLYRANISFDVVSWTKHSRSDGSASFLLFVRTVLPHRDPEAPSGRAPEVGGQALQNNSCCPRLHCTEWSCV